MQLNWKVGTRLVACSVEFAFGELEHAVRHVPTKQNPRKAGVLKELFVQWCLDFVGIIGYLT
jgi:hypothetical protein